MNWGSSPGFSGSTASEQFESRSSSLTFQLEAPAEITGESPGSSLDQRVSRAQAISVPAVKRSRDLIASTLGTLPIQARNKRREIVDNYLLEQPEPDIARSVTMTKTVEDMLFEGRSWWRITRFGWDGFPVQVRRLEPRSVQVRQDSRVYVSLDGTPQGQAMEWVPDELLIRIDSPNDPLLVAGARAIRSALLLDRTAAGYAKEPLPLGYFTPKEGVADVGDKEDVEELLDDWEKSRQKRSWAYIGAALEANSLSWNPEQLQLESQRQHAVLEIARIAGIDPEDLGVSTTTRTYANAEQRRLDLVDFTLAAYVTAIEDRFSMNDVTPRGTHVKFQYDGFLRSDTKTRMETYQVGREVGVYDDERIAKIEDIPSARPQRPAQQAPRQQEGSVQQSDEQAAVSFAADEEPTATIAFDTAEVAETFRVNPDKRTISGLAVPWGKVARSGFSQWKFKRGSLHWADESRVKMLRNHNHDEAIGRATRLENTANGLDVTFKVARGEEGDRALQLAEDGVLDGLSVGIDFTDGDEWQPDPEDEGVRLVNKASLREVSITAMPAFDSARVASVAASQKGSTMPEVAEQTAAAEQTSVTASAPDLTEFTAGLSESIKTAVSEAFKNLPQPQGEREVVPAGRAVVTNEAPVYAMNGQGASLVRDAWRARTENDAEARERLGRFQKQTTEAAETALFQQQTDANFAGNTTNASAIIPPGYRPDLYVTQLMQGRPMTDSVSRGTLSDATPFTIPSFTSSSGLAADHTEGSNPSAGSLTIDTVTVTPQAVSGLFELTREIADSSNPAIDAIAMQAMQEAYAQQTEQKVYTKVNGSDGQGGTITSGFVPSGAQVRLVSGGDGEGGSGTANGADLIAGIRSQMARYPFNRFAQMNRAHVSQSATSALAAATGSDGRPLLPTVGPQNTLGTGNATQSGWFIDGLAFEPSWSMTGSAAGDADVLMFNANDIWAWESPLLTFRFEERGGPARIDLALFGYFATQVLRPVGLSSVRYDTSTVA